MGMSPSTAAAQAADDATPRAPIAAALAAALTATRAAALGTTHGAALAPTAAAAPATALTTALAAALAADPTAALAATPVATLATVLVAALAAARATTFAATLAAARAAALVAAPAIARAAAPAISTASYATPALAGDKPTDANGSAPRRVRARCGHWPAVRTAPDPPDAASATSSGATAVAAAIATMAVHNAAVAITTVDAPSFAATALATSHRPTLGNGAGNVVAWSAAGQTADARHRSPPPGATPRDAAGAILLRCAAWQRRARRGGVAPWRRRWRLARSVGRPAATAPNERAHHRHLCPPIPWVGAVDSGDGIRLASWSMGTLCGVPDAHRRDSGMDAGRAAMWPV